MLVLIFLLAVLFFGYSICANLILHTKLPIVVSTFFVGSLFSIPLVFVLLFAFKNLEGAIIIFIFLVSLFVGLSVKNFVRELKKEVLNFRETILNILLFTLFFLLFERSFAYDGKVNSILIQTNLFQDFGAHIPFIRAFSMGNATTPEVPFFAGMGLLYHFMFDFYAAILEKLGLRIDYAMNLLSALSLLGLFNVFKYLSQILFKSKIPGIFALVFLLFSTDLSILQLFNQYGFSFSEWYNHNTYFPVNSLGINIEKYFLNINTFLNQRHLLFGLLIFFSFFYILLAEKVKSLKKIIFLSLLIGFSPFWHVQVTAALYIFLISLFVLFRERRGELLKIIVISLIFSFPQLLLIKSSSVNRIVINPGFLLHNTFTFKNFLLFWIWNFGLLLPLGIWGFIRSNTFQRKILFSSLPIFIIPNIFQFSQDIFDNHKFFNIWIVFLGLFAGVAVKLVLNRSVPLKIVASAIVIVTISSGIFHMLVVKNDIYASVVDIASTPLGKYVNNNIGSGDIVLTNGQIYDPVSLIGVRTFIGRAHYIYLYGGNPDSRVIEKDIILKGFSDSIFRILSSNKITYVIIYKEGEVFNPEKANMQYLNKSFKKVYEDDTAIIYKI